MFGILLAYCISGCAEDTFARKYKQKQAFVWYFARLFVSLQTKYEKRYEKSIYSYSAFINKFDEHLAKNYFITGERGGAKKITLPRDLIIWE